MPRRHPVPRLWLMTDERMGEGLWDAILRLPRGGGIVFRHYATDVRERRVLFARILRIARRRGLVVVRAGSAALPGEMGTHGRRGSGVVTWPAHDRHEAVRALRQGAQAVFVSPVFASRSHPGGKALGPRHARQIAAGMPLVRIALGGMTARRFRTSGGFDGWAAIDAWTGNAAKPRRRTPLRGAGQACAR